MDERVVIPKTLRPNIMRSPLYGHSGRNSMLAIVFKVFFGGVRFHREVVSIARARPQC